MKLQIHCITCAFENAGPRPSQDYEVPIRDDGLYELFCKNGHPCSVILQAQLFEILFQVSAHAICDNYYREAISSANSALERFYELAIMIICDSNSIPRDLIEKGWKEIARQSERQLGAFIFNFLNALEIMPNLPSPSMVRLRNDVIHKGKIPTDETATKFIQDVYEVIIGNLYLLHENGFAEQINNSIFNHQAKARRKIQDATSKVSFLGISTLINVSNFALKDSPPKCPKTLSVGAIKSVVNG